MLDSPVNSEIGLTGIVYKGNRCLLVAKRITTLVNNEFKLQAKGFLLIAKSPCFDKTILIHQ